ncbi:facilitated trehalose transporter Tret1-like isoform X1 [Leptidea sinapis]|uniref:facilitated trehalose transporter Tret1-like isoform X1 n=1 Tax=Leptidea sinapis TaxID=189913 RepID=UPI002134FB36|nr:facilitated trehalose transporter Tret1-like isoform X1 [Leptidea sinapis]
MKIQISSALLRQYAIVLSVNLNVLATGVSLAWSSPMLVKLQDPEKTPLSRPLTDAEASWVVSLGFILAAGSNFVGGYLIDFIGRKYCILAVSIPKLLTAILLICATELWMVILGRSVMFMADCFVLVVVPIYAAEIASKDQRGALGTLLQVFSSLGIVISLAIGPNVSYHVLSYILLGLIILVTVPVIFIPESPYYLHSDGKTGDSLKILTLLRESDTQAKQELADYELTIDKTFDKMACFKDKIFVKALLITLLLFGGTQFVGFNSVSVYLQTILISTNTNVMPEVASAIIGAIQVVSSLFVTFIMSTFGRKTILLVSLAGMCAGMFALGSFFQTITPGDQITGFMNYLPIISLILVVVCYSAGIGAIVWPATTELFEGQARAFGVSIGLTFCQIAMFFITKYFSTMTNALGPAPTYWFYGTNCVIIAVVIAIFLPETKGKTFAEIQKALGKKDAKENITS